MHKLDGIFAVNWPNLGERINADKERKAQREVGPLAKTISVRSEGTTVQMCDDSKVAERCVNGNFAMAKKHRETESKELQNTYQSWWNTGPAYPIQKNGDYVQHIYRAQSRG